MATIYTYSDTISAVPKQSNEQPLGEKRTSAKFQINTSKTDGLDLRYYLRQ